MDDGVFDWLNHPRCQITSVCWRSQPSLPGGEMIPTYDQITCRSLRSICFIIRRGSSAT